MSQKQKIVLALKLFSIFLVLSAIFSGTVFVLNSKNYSFKISKGLSPRSFLASVSCPLSCAFQGGCTTGNNSCYSYEEGQYKCQGTDSWICQGQENNCVISYRWDYFEGCQFKYPSVCGGSGCASNQKPTGTCVSGVCQVSCVTDASCCTNECSSIGANRCSGGLKQTCGNYDADTCLEWNSGSQCSGDVSCGYGNCQSNQKPSWYCNPSTGGCDYSCQDDITCCANECASPGQTDCFDEYTKETCGQYDSDPCLDWRKETCGGDVSCGYGSCQDNQKPVWACKNGTCAYDCFFDATCCTNECDATGLTKCSDTGNKQICGNFDTDVCLEWSPSQNCTAGKPTICGYGTCKNTEKPTWGCSGTGNCTYTCVKDSSCSSGLNCNNECPTSGDSQCESKNLFKFCGYFGSDACLHWSDSKTCSGTTSCGALTCENSQRPSWSCVNNKCDYTCVNDSVCASSPANCKDECPTKGDTECSGDAGTKTCDTNFDADACLEWGPTKPCECSGDTGCGAQGCPEEQRPSCKCDNGKCVLICVDDQSCSNQNPNDDDNNSNGTYNAVCGDGICDQGEDLSCTQDCQQTALAINVTGKGNNAVDWKNSIIIYPRDTITVRLNIKNNTQKDFSNVSLRADLPKDIIYGKGLKVDDVASGNDIRYGIDLGVMSVNSERVVTFIVSASSNVKDKVDEEIKGTVTGDGVSSANVLKITIDKKSSGATWYVWLIAIFIVVAIIVGFLVFKARIPVQ